MMFMSEALLESIPFSSVYLHWLVRDEQWRKMSKSLGNGIDPLKLIEQYWADALRWALVLWNTPWTDQKFQEWKVEYVWKFINKVRNATRFIVNAQSSHDLPLQYEELKQTILERIGEANDYDIRMVWKIDEKLASINRYMNKNMLWEALQETIDLLWHDLCDWYIEITKISSSAITPHVLLYSILTNLKLLHPALPFMSEKLWQNIWVEWALIVQPWPTKLDAGSKNYRINLVMDIISQRRTLRQAADVKPHESVSVFVQWNKDIHLLVEAHQHLITSIVNISEITMIDEFSDSPDDYETRMLMDIKVWLKGTTERDPVEVLRELEQQKVEEEQFLQRIRSTLTAPWFAEKAPAKVVEEKKKKMEEVKSKIAQIDYEINKRKMKNK